MASSQDGVFRQREDLRTQRPREGEEDAEDGSGSPEVLAETAASASFPVQAPQPNVTWYLSSKGRRQRLVSKEPVEAGKELEARR